MRAKHWNYRVVSHQGYLAIHEVYYELGKPVARTLNPIDVSGESIESLRQTLTLMQKALGEPILEDSDFLSL